MTDISNNSKVLPGDVHTYFIDLEENLKQGTLLKIIFNKLVWMDISFILYIFNNRIHLTHIYSVICKYVYYRFQSKINAAESRQLGLYRIKIWDHETNSYTYNQDVTQFEAIHAREVFPCFDQPDMKGI